MAGRSAFLYLLLLPLLLIGPGPIEAEDAARKTLVRVEDFITLAGKDAPAVLGVKPARLRLYACRAGACQPVPLQVDKLDKLGRYVFPTDPEKDRDGAVLDDNDELSFMAEDAGDRMPPGFQLEGAGKTAELELTDPIDGGKAWAYLIELPGDAPKLADYIAYQVDGENVLLKSAQYELGWKKGAINADYLKLTREGGGLSADLLDRQKVGLQAQLASDVQMPFNAPESLIEAVDVAVIDGPIRVIIDQVVNITIANLKAQWGTEYFVKYYRCGQNNSVYFDFPSSANILRNLSFYWSLDFTDEIVGSSYIDPNHPTPLPIEKQKVEGVPGDSPHYWYGVLGKNGAVVEALDVDDEILNYFACDGRWRQNPKALDTGGDERGRNEFGFACRETTAKRPNQKQYHWYNFILIPKNPSLDGVLQMRNLIEKPLSVTTRPVVIAPPPTPPPPTAPPPTAPAKPAPATSALPQPAPTKPAPAKTAPAPGATAAPRPK